MGGIGGPELILVFIVVLLVFGPRKIPEIARAMGRGMREFRRLSTEFQREINVADALEGRDADRPPHRPRPKGLPPEARPPATSRGGSDASGPDTPGPDRPGREEREPS